MTNFLMGKVSDLTLDTLMRSLISKYETSTFPLEMILKVYTGGRLSWAPNLLDGAKCNWLLSARGGPP
jgi:hypothetical protein